MRRRLLSVTALILIFSMILPFCAMAADEVVLNTIGNKKQGKTVTINGSTDILKEVTVKVLKPDNSVLYINVLSVDEYGKFKDSFTLPSNAATGTYTVVVGQGNIVASTTFSVSRDSGGGSGGSGGGSREETQEPAPQEEPPTPTEPTTEKKTFEDIANYTWAKDAIETLATLGVIQGTSETTFEPDKNISRADFITLLVRMLKLFELDLGSADDSNFADVEEGTYYYEPVALAKKLGIVQGIGGDIFNPTGQITREDLMVMIVRALKLAGKITTDATYDDISGFGDAGNVSDYAVESVAILVKEGIIMGNPDNTINPKGNATRAETAVILYRVYLKYFANEQAS